MNCRKQMTAWMLAAGVAAGIAGYANGVEAMPQQTPPQQAQPQGMTFVGTVYKLKQGQYALIMGKTTQE